MTAGVITTVLLGTGALYAASAIASWRRRPGVSAGLMVVGWLGCLAVFFLNWVACGGPPFGNMYHVMVVLSACFPPLLLLLRRKEDVAGLDAYFALGAALTVIGALSMEKETVWRRMPALQSGWFVPHVLSYMIAYSLATVAFIYSVPARIRAKRIQTGIAPGDDALYQVLRLAFPFMTFGLCSGALWADDAWGTYWSWDPKETWSLVTWTLYAMYFHCRRDAVLRRWATIVQMLAFAALVTTFLLVNLLPKLSSALHSYA